MVLSFGKYFISLNLERDFFRQTGIYKTDTTVFVGAGTTILFTKPATVMDIDRISYNRKRLRRVSSWDLERADPDWRVNPNGQATSYHEDHLPNVNQFEIDHRPAAAGRYRLFCDTLPTAHSAYVGEYLNVHDVWEPYIRWEVLSLALAKDGDAQDIARSGYAHQRYLFGIQLAKRLIFGDSYTIKVPMMGM